MYQKKCTGLKKLRNVTKVIILSMRGNSYIYNWPLGLRDQITLIAENAEIRQLFNIKKKLIP